MQKLLHGDKSILGIKVEFIVYFVCLEVGTGNFVSTCKNYTAYLFWIWESYVNYLEAIIKIYSFNRKYCMYRLDICNYFYLFLYNNFRF